MAVFKLLLGPEWEAFERDGRLMGAPIDLQDGFVHLSTGAQVEETARLYFAEVGDLVLVALDEDRLGGALRWEPSRGGELFPHLFREMRREDVLWSATLPLEGGRHRFPAL